ncbi:phosphoribosylformylglycinamidine cyclo-ligase [Ignatzschineria indica]|uniref:Phosphoribosylformylglycinamidine cyclo-ligase n=1 Tax=Ignatzschineria indica TaxID=472583 RepID=A0A2U2AMB7_9GAMM|nr:MULTISPECIES: phosphoribosylformylglycinamidine cyclo-ligase [Ignatzschineria]OYQ81861.1 phosphoribosylformylglycinamidine cyclo-ligase [Ignatzschineria sp. F8392]PWD84362.1 phosphoribosylformylglycinamidine cyclo-ligase [Ignatzschineria indica]GGZ75870.1 phosphoribosylformylglycinamidine cyclo-ligase [Ignatzschineria indica]
MSDAYREAGVNLEAGYESVERIKKHVASTMRIGAMDIFGDFGGSFDLSELNYQKPVLVSGTDGVGTKLKLAFEMDIHDTIGIDAVAMCVNDILTQGAEPLFFLDYIACGKNNPAQIEAIVKGVAEGSKLSGAALLGGETAEMPGFYQDGEYDIAGFAVGVVEKDERITKANVKVGDKIIGLPSSGVHSNGFSLVRHIIKEKGLDFHTTYEGFDKPLGEVLLTPTEIYVKPILNLLKEVKVNAMAHITGGGFYENVPRMLSGQLGARFEQKAWNPPAIFPFLQKAAGISDKEMFTVFNMGIGYMIVVDPSDVEQTLSLLPTATLIGEITESGEVEIV